MKPSDPAALENFRRAIIEELTRVMPLEGGGSMPHFLYIFLKSAEEARKKGGKATEFVWKEFKEALTLGRSDVIEQIKVAVEYKCAAQERFDKCRRLKLPPPDIVPHPDHVIITDDGFRIVGPMYREPRRQWEALKYGIRGVVEDIESAKADLRENPDNIEAQLMLDLLTRVRRKLMRLVPKGWNWTETIWTCDGDVMSIKQVYDEVRAENLAKMPAKLRAEFGI